MVKLNITENNIIDTLSKLNITVDNCKIVPKDTGQKKVFFVSINGKEYACKAVDVTPYELYEELYIFTPYDISNLDQEIGSYILQTIKSSCKRINTEIKMNKNCSNLPQLVFFNELKYTNINNYYWVALYIEEKFSGSSLKYNDNYRDNEVLDFLLQLIDQIDIMYQKGYVHRDIKPDNIIVDNGIYKIIDGGLGKNLKEDEENSVLSHNFLGTKGYWAPEQENYPPDYSWNFQTDLYPLGIMAIEMYIPELRRKFSTIRDLDELYIIWKNKFSKRKKTMLVFKDIIVMLSSHQKLNRFNSLEMAREEIKKLMEVE